MKRIFALVALFPLLCFGAAAPANSITIQQVNSTGTGMATRQFLPNSGTEFTTLAQFNTALGLGTGNSPVFTGLTLSGLTSGRVPYISTGGLLANAATFTFNSGTGALTATTFIGAVTGNASTATALATARTIAITGDLAYASPPFDGSGNVTAAGTLATVASAGTTGSSTAIPVITIDAKGRTTGITTAAVVAPAGTLSGATLASGVTASSLTSFGNNPTINTNAWAINTTGQVFYFEGASIMRGNGLGTAQLANGGLTGNFGNLLASSVWASGKGTYYNDGVDGTTTTQVLARYTVGNSTYGVTVPSAHSLSPVITGSTNRAIFFVLGDQIYNGTPSLSSATMISDLTSLYTSAHADGYFVVMMTCPVVRTADTAATAKIIAVDNAIKNGTIPSDLVLDAATWLTNQSDTGYYQGDALHPNAAGHVAMGANLRQGMTNGAAPIAYGGNYFTQTATFLEGTSGDISMASGNLILTSSTGTISVGQTTAASAIANPNVIDLGGNYGNTTAGKNFKIKTFNDGNAADTAGIGHAANSMEFTAPQNANFNFYTNAATTPVKIATIATGTGSLALGNTTNLATATPLTVNLGGTYGNGTAGTNFKLKVYDGNSTGAVGGLGVGAGTLDITAQSSSDITFYVHTSGGTPTRLGRMLGSSTGQFSWDSTTASTSPTTGSGIFAGGLGVAGAINQGGKTSTYNNIATSGWGLPAIYGTGRSTAQTAAVTTVATYTVGAADGSFEVSANVNVTTATAHSFSVTCTYTDETSASRTITMPFIQVGGVTLIGTITNITGSGPYEGVPLHIRAKTATAITLATTGTFTTVTYNVEGVIKQTL